MTINTVSAITQNLLRLAKYGVLSANNATEHFEMLFLLEDASSGSFMIWKCQFQALLKENLGIMIHNLKCLRALSVKRMLKKSKSSATWK